MKKYKWWQKTFCCVNDSVYVLHCLGLLLKHFSLKMLLWLGPCSDFRPCEEWEKAIVTANDIKQFVGVTSRLASDAEDD